MWSVVCSEVKLSSHLSVISERDIEVATSDLLKHANDYETSHTKKVNVFHLYFSISLLILS